MYLNVAANSLMLQLQL